MKNGFVLSQQLNLGNHYKPNICYSVSTPDYHTEAEVQLVVSISGELSFSTIASNKLIEIFDCASSDRRPPPFFLFEFVVVEGVGKPSGKQAIITRSVHQQ